MRSTLLARANWKAGTMVGAALPWERPDGPPQGTGICVSGGGLRSASFALGVLQALQEERGLLYGERSADLLSAVSGGSFTAASHTLEASRRSRSTDSGPSPLAHGSPEEQHILGHADYLARDFARIASVGVLNLLSFMLLFVWTGMMLADFAAIVEAVELPQEIKRLILPDRPDDVGAIVACVVLVAALYLVIHGLFADVGWWYRSVVPLVGLALVAAMLPRVMHGLIALAAPWSPMGTTAIVGASLVAIAAVTVLSARAFKAGVQGRAAVWLNRLSVWFPRFLGLYLLGWTAVAWYPLLAPVLEERSDAQVERAGVAFVLTLVGALVFGLAIDRLTLHREVRRSVASCFAVRRSGNGVEPTSGVLLSELVPPVSGPTRYPRLLISATANVDVRLPDGSSSSFGPYVFSHDACGIPGVQGADLPTAKLELVETPAGLGKERLVSLMTAVAATGAAISPGMGRATLPSARMLIAAAGIRLGRWMPNPLSARVQDLVRKRTTLGRLERDHRLGPGYSDLVPEMVGISGPRIYVSDGGHYDNLGLMCLLRARCAQIWCVDAPPEPAGEAAELRRVLSLAQQQLRIENDLDLDRFRANSDGFYGVTHLAGTLTYPEGGQARLVVIKLGLTAQSSPELVAYRVSDRGFPHHATIHQVYRHGRMDAYRRLGHESAKRCLAEVDA
jgi:hypothetical protein